MKEYIKNRKKSVLVFNFKDWSVKKIETCSWDDINSLYRLRNQKSMVVCYLSKNSSWNLRIIWTGSFSIVWSFEVLTKIKLFHNFWVWDLFFNVFLFLVSQIPYDCFGSRVIQTTNSCWLNFKKIFTSLIVISFT